MNIDINDLNEKEFLIRGSINRLNIIFDEENITIINRLIKFMNANIFIFNEFENLYSFLSKDYIKLRFIITDIVYYKLKEIFIYNNDEEKRKLILDLLTFIKNNFNENSNQDKKQELLVIFLEYFKIKN